jgi:hypothetical protein
MALHWQPGAIYHHLPAHLLHAVAGQIRAHLQGAFDDIPPPQSHLCLTALEHVWWG